MRRFQIAAAVTAGLLAGLPAPPAEAQNAGASSVRMIPVEGEATRYWSRWRGPSGQGLVEGTGYPDRWSETDNVVWRTPVPGSGNSSPIVWGDRIFLTTGRTGGRRLSVLAFRRSDGELLWETDVAPGGREYVHPKNGPAAATPVTDGERVYASFGSRGLVAVDFDGNRLWHTEVGQIDNYHGPAGSPLLYGDRIILYQDQRPGGLGAAYDPATGGEVWR